MRMSYEQQASYREKMFRRTLGSIDSRTGELYAPAAARKKADELLRKKMSPYPSIADVAPGLEDGYPRVPGVWNERIAESRKDKALMNEFYDNRDNFSLAFDIEEELDNVVVEDAAIDFLEIGRSFYKHKDFFPVLKTASGKQGIPVLFLVRLKKELTKNLKQVVLEETQKAEALEVSIEATDPHSKNLERSRIYHELVAADFPRGLDIAEYNLYKWERKNLIHPTYADKWRVVLEKSPEEISAIIAEKSSEADDLRQNSPLAGLLSEPVRNKLYS